MAKFRHRRPRPTVTKKEHLTNKEIRVPEIRIVGDDLEKIAAALDQPVEIGVYSTRKALAIAEEAGLDLVMISPRAVPPVCKIIDYKKYVYQQKKKKKEIKSKAAKTVIKEIRFGPNTDDHDFDFKVKHAKKFLEDGHKVKAFVQFRGRNIVFKDRGNLLLLRFLKELEEYGVTEALPKLEGRRMFLIINSKKKAKTK